MAKTQARPERDDVIVELVALFHEGTMRSDLGRAVGKLKVWERGRTPSAGEIEPVLDALTAAGWLEERTDGVWWVAKDRLWAVVKRAWSTGRFDQEVALVQELRPAALNRPERRLRDLALAVWAGRWSQAKAVLAAGPADEEAWLAAACEGVPREHVLAMPSELQVPLLCGRVERAREALDPVEVPLAWLMTARGLTPRAREVAAHTLILQGRFDEARALVEAGPGLEAMQGWLQLVMGRFAEAVQAFEAATKSPTGRRRALPGTQGIMHAAAHLLVGTPEAVGALRAQAKSSAFSVGLGALERQAYSALLGAARRLMADDAEVPPDSASPPGGFDAPAVRLMIHLARTWGRERPLAAVREAARALQVKAEASGYAWLAEQAGHIAGGERVSAPSAGVDLSRAAKPVERWAEVLRALAELARPTLGPVMAAPRAPEEGDRRLAWVVKPGPGSGRIDEIEPREQVRSKKGWSAGRRVALMRLHEELDTFEYATKQDRRVCACIVESVSYTYARYQDVSYSLSVSAALRALVGHPLLFVAGDGGLSPGRVRVETPRLAARREGKRVRLALEPSPRVGAGYADDDDEGEEVIELRDDGEVVITEFRGVHYDIARVLGSRGIELPRRAEAALAETLAQLASKVTVEADALASPAEVAPVEADPQPVLLLRPAGAGLSIEAMVRPLGVGGPTVPAGRGAPQVMAAVDGEARQAVRDLSAERARLAAVVARAPGLAEAEVTERGWRLEDREAALAALEGLSAEGGPALEWPDGRPLSLSPAAGLAQLSLRVLEAEGGDLVVDGALEWAEERVEWGELVEYLSASPSRFLASARRSRILALSAELRARLDDLLLLGRRAKDGLRIHPLLAPQVAALAEGAALQASAAFSRQVARLTEVGPAPRVPATLQADLRPYQEEGFVWLARLAGLGLGACLADDMGLGKTVQTIAVLLHRAEAGPSLVVAPTSVLSVWEAQLAAFGPTLRALTYHGPGRAAHLEGLGPFDVVITSYAVLVQDVEALAAVRFQVAVLDEAQAVKNAASQRAQAARRIEAHARIATTGTPVENHAGELWALFRCINPGLLGSAQRFEARFAAPIEKRRDAAALDRLKRLVRPFILRRTKAQVLEELPPRPRSSLRVELAEPEAAPVRDGAGARPWRPWPGDGDPAARRMRLLAALTKPAQDGSAAPALGRAGEGPGGRAPRGLRRAPRRAARRPPQGAGVQPVRRPPDDPARAPRRAGDPLPVPRRRDPRGRAEAPRRRLPGGPRGRLPHQPARRAGRGSRSPPPTTSSTWTRGGTPPSSSRPPTARTASARSAPSPRTASSPRTRWRTASWPCITESAPWPRRCWRGRRPAPR
jgi:hypothetical protein